MVRKRFTTLSSAFFQAEPKSSLSENYKICTTNANVFLEVKFTPIGLAVANDVFIEELVGDTLKRRRLVPVGDADPNKDGDIHCLLGKAKDLVAKKLYVFSTVAATAQTGAPVRAKLKAAITGCPKEWKGALEKTISQAGGSVNFLIEVMFY